MPDRVDFDVQVEPPSLDHYRREWTPSPGVGLAGMWIGAVVADASGQEYWAVRGTDDFVVGMTQVLSPPMGFKKLQKTFDLLPTTFRVQTPRTEAARHI